MADERCLWIDLETGGLDARKHFPYEVGLMLTDKDGGNRYSESWLIWEDTREWAVAMGEAAADSYVGPMHEKSGLWDDLVDRRSEALTRGMASSAMIEWLYGHNVEPRTLPLFGSSIGSLDRPFVIEHFPSFNEFTHYRNVDVSTVKELCRRHAPTIYAALKEQDWYEADAVNKAHRVLDDIRVSIAEYQFYVDNFLWCE